MLPPMTDTLTMPFPFLAEVPKRERPAIMDGWAELEEFQEMVRQDGAAIPVTFAAKLLNVSKQRVYELMATGRLQKIELGGHGYVTADSLVAWGKAERKVGRPAGIFNGKKVHDGVALAKAAMAYGQEVGSSCPKNRKK